MAIGEWGKPVRVRTDNASVFNSKVWRFGLKALGIKRQFTQPGSPWQNGRMERLFGTLKERWMQLIKPLRLDTELRLAEFTHWYNAIRPHQHLGGQTPLEVWQA
jgi:putative transposase